MKELFLVFLLWRSSLQDCSWNSCHPVSDEPDVLTAHLIPHTHDDLGWIKTVDQYYYGSKPELVPVGVQYIYNTVIDELLKNPERKFSFAETGFLWRWFTSHDDFNKHQLQKLVKNGQIELIGGGWVQNDEATSHYVDIIDQMTLGLQRLSQIFGECGKPQVGWQIDPFGHSIEMANIYAQMGYSSLYFARIHYLEKKLRLQNKTLEFNWAASKDLGTKIFTGAFFQDNYGPPEGFCWDSLCGDDPIMDNPSLGDYNVEQKVDAFVAHVKKQASFQKTNQVMLLMGSDFQYTNANSWYTNLDKLIKYVNADSSKKVKVIYSTPSCYTKAALKEHKSFTNKTDDFFPYASEDHSYWTGYFTSRPTFKRMIRQASSMLQLAKQLDVIADLGPEDDSDIEILREAAALVQHHDAVTGTAKENVTRDYEMQLARGMKELEVVVNDFMTKMNPKAVNSNLVICPLLNETICTPVRDASTFSVVIFNSNGWYKNGTVKIPLYKKSASVENALGKKIQSQVVRTFDVKTLRDDSRAPYELSFYVSVPSLGYTTIFVEASDETNNTDEQPRKIRKAQNLTIENENLIVGFDDLGYLSYIYNKNEKVKQSIRQEFFYYEGVDKSESQPSGAYIFRPKSQGAKALQTLPKVEIVQGPLVNEIRQTLGPWASQIIRLPKNQTFLEFEWIVGPIPKEASAPITKEIVTRYITDIQSNNVFYTDSNGRQAIRREFDKATSFEYSDDEPIAGNYYPITSFGYMRDNKTQLTLLTERAQGLTSADGFIEVMLHRRCFYDDHFGVEEALDEPGKDGNGLVASGTHRIFFSSPKTAASVMRPLAAEIFHEPVLAFSVDKKPEKFKYNRILEYSGLTEEAPSFFHVLTVEKWEKKKILLRIENLIYGDDNSMANAKQLSNIEHMFTSFDIVNVTMLMLGANRNMTSPAKNLFTNNAPGPEPWARPSEIFTVELDIRRK